MDGIFEHYKGKRYKLLYVADHTETREKLVIYQQLYENEYPYGYVWCRPYDMFYGEVVYDNKTVKRFTQMS